MSGELEHTQTLSEARWDWLRASANYYGFRIGVPIGMLAVISGISGRYEWGFKEAVGDVTGIPYEDIDLTLTLVDFSIIGILGWLGAGSVAKKLLATMKEEGVEFREKRAEQKKSK